MTSSLSRPLRWGLVFVCILLTTAFFQRTSTPPDEPTLEVTLWAQQPMLRNPVAISHDPMGRLYATEANRRRSVDLDVRGMRGLEPYPWPALDYSIQSVDQRRAILREYLATNSRFENPWMKDYDENGIINWRDLLAKTERVNLLEDTDGDGVADKATVFADDFNSEVTGTAGGVLWLNDQVYFTVIPDLWLLKDTNGDAKADQKTILHTGHGVHIGQGGHDLHALTLGPDGRIYWTVGDKGINITSKEGRRFFYPNQGVLMRSELDGSDFEVFAHGLRNCQEISFDNFGNLFCVDNDGDFKGERERLVYITQGSDTGWRINWQYNHTDKWAQSQRLPMYNPWMEEGLSVPHFEGQAAYITPALSNYSDGPAGFIRNPGTALSELYADYYFLTQFPGKLITAFQLQPKDASFEMVNEHIFQKGFMGVGMSFSPKGELFVADWAGEWYPTEDGAIVKIDVPKEERNPMRERTEILIREGMTDRPIPELVTLLDHPDQRVRQNAQFELVSQNEAKTLIRTAFDTSAKQLARVHSIWGIGQLARKKSLSLDRSVIPLLLDQDPQIQIQTARLISDSPGLFYDTKQTLVELLNHSHDHVRFHAAMALGSAGDVQAIPSLVQVLEENDNDDPFIRHAAVSGLAGIGDIKALTALASYSSSAVRTGAVVALRRLESPSVSTFLNDKDELVVLEAARAIHDDFGIPEALPELAALVNTTPHMSNEALMRRVLNANLRVGEPANAKAVLLFAADNAHEESLQLEALDVLYTWTEPPILDRVERRYRLLPKKEDAVIQNLLREHSSQLLNTKKSNVVKNVYQILDRYGISLEPAELQRRLADDSLPATERIEALRMLANQSGSSENAFRTAFESRDVQLRTTALALLAPLDERSALRRIDVVINEDGPTIERQNALALLGTLTSPQAKSLLEKQVVDLERGNVPAAEQLDVFLAAQAQGNFEDRLSKIAQRAGSGNRAPYDYTLEGGKAERGETVYLQHGTAQCIRCHAVEGSGSNVGPNLRGIGSRMDREQLLEALVEPGNTMAEGFDSGNGISIMPPMGMILEPTELRDLIEYLAGL